jgi:putative transposase
VHPSASLYKRHRFPGELSSHAVWRSFRFLLSERDVEELLAERGISVSDETIRRWCQTFGSTFADGVRRRRPRPGDKWHLDEAQLKSNGKQNWLWRAVDQDGIVLDILVQQRRNQEAAQAFLHRVVDGGGYQPRVVITDTLASYPPAVRRVLPGVEHRRHKGLNNRAENSHRPTRRRERVLQRFKSPAHAQQFLAPFGPISDHFRPVAISSPPLSITPCCRRASRPGVRSRDSPPRRGRPPGATTPRLISRRPPRG